MDGYSDHEQSSSEKGTPQPEGKRRRVTQGDLCSEQRAKCDNQKPCSRCIKRGTDCTYLRQPKRRGPPKGTANTMRERLNRLEQIYEAVKGEELMGGGAAAAIANGVNGNHRFHSMSASGSISGGDDDTLSPNGHLSPGMLSRDIKPSRAALAAAENASTNGVAGRMAIGSVLAPKAKRTSFSSSAPNQPGPGSSMQPPLFLMASDSSLSLMLPSEVFAAVMDTYFTLVYPTVPVIHRYSLEKNPHFYPSALLFSIMALGVRLTEHPYFDTPAVRDQWADCLIDQAHKLLQPVILDPSRVHYHMVVALIHLTKYFDHFKGSVLMSARCTDLIFVLIRELKLEEQVIEMSSLPRWIQFEEFRRLRWNQYFHDRCLTYGAGAAVRPFSLSLASLINMKFPVTDTIWINNDTTEPIATSAPITLSMFERDMSTYPIFMGDLGPFSRQIVLFSIFEKVIGFLNGIPNAETKENITHFLATWYECQPPLEKSLSSGVVPSHSTIYLMILFHTMMVIIHSPSKLDDMWEDEGWLLSQDFLVAAEHAGLCTSYLEINPVALQFAPYFVKIFVQRVFCMHLMLAQKLSHEESFQLDLRRKVQLHVQALATMGKTDRMSRITAKLLAITAEGSLGDLGPVSNGNLEKVHEVVDKTFTPEEVTVLADLNKGWNSEHTGFWAQIRSLIRRTVGAKDTESPSEL